MGQDHGHSPFASIARIGAQVLGAALLWRRTLDHNGIEYGLNLRHVVCVRSRHDERQRDATPVHQQMVLAAFPPPIRRVGAHCLLRQRGLEHRCVNALPALGDALEVIVFGQAHLP